MNANPTALTSGAESLMTPTELSHYLGVPVPTLYAWRYRSEGPRAIRVGRHLRWRRADVDRWLDSQRDTSPAA